MEEAGLKQLNEEIYHLSPCGFFTCRPDGIIIKVNKTFLELTGYEEEELLNQVRWQSLLTGGGKIFHETHYIQLLNLQGYVKEVNFNLVKKDGSQVPVLINTTKVQNNEMLPLFHSSVLDITQRKLYEKELLLSKRRAEELVDKLKATNAELEQFSYNVSHDLQEPLAAIKGYLQLLQLKSEENSDEDSKRMLGRAFESVKKMTTFIKDLLDYSRLGNQHAQHEIINLNEVWENVYRTFELRIIEEKAEVKVSSLPEVQGNSTQIERLFQNLLSNSLKYRNDKPLKIHLDAVRENEVWRFSFKDNGIGFKQESATKIFNFLQRLPDSKNVTGTGIGLAATKRIVERHGGEIKAESKPGEGATFIFTLPAIPEPTEESINNNIKN